MRRFDKDELRMTTNRKLMAFSLLLTLLPSISSLASADCVNVTFDVPEAFRNSDLVFSGIVTRVDFNDRLGFRVDRVWKGPVDREISVYQLDTPFVGSYVFRPKPEVKYIIFARELSADDRKLRVKADESRAFGIHGSCGDGPRWSLEHVHILDRIAKGNKPRH